MRFKILKSLLKHEDARAHATVTINNWVQPLVQQFVTRLVQTARGAGDLEDWDRLGPTCPTLWSQKPVRHSNGKLMDMKWTFTTMPAIAELAKLQLVSPDTSSVVGAGPMILKSGGKILSMAPPLTIRSSAVAKGVGFLHFVEVSFTTVVIKNSAEAKIKIGTTALHPLEVSAELADVDHWKVLPPYDNFKRYMQKTLPLHIRQIRSTVKGNVDLPQVPNRVWDAAKKWRKKPSPGAAQHAAFTNPRLTKRLCGQIEPDHLRVLREQREQAKWEQQASRKKQQQRKRGRGTQEGPARNVGGDG